MKVLAIIPARGGSKRLLLKNGLEIAGRPLLVWSILAARESKLVDRVVVSSDHPILLDIARRYGADVIERPASLATDTAATDPVLAHAIRELSDRDGYVPDLVVLLQPTVPHRRPGLVDDCIRRLLDTDAGSVMTARPLPYVWWREDKGGWVEGADWRTNNPGRLRSQEVPASDLRWEEDGSVYVTRTEYLVSADPRMQTPPHRITGRHQVFPNERTVDIDTRREFVMAEALLKWAASWEVLNAQDGEAHEGVGGTQGGRDGGGGRGPGRAARGGWVRGVPGRGAPEDGPRGAAEGEAQGVSVKEAEPV